MRDMDIYHTISGQRDPTAGAALSKIIGEERKAERLAGKKLQAITSPRKFAHSVATVEPCRDLVHTAIAVAYQDYVRVLRLLETIPEPAPTEDEKVIAKHNKRIEKLKAEMEEIEEFFYSPLYGLACDISPDVLINKAWKEAYK